MPPGIVRDIALAPLCQWSDLDPFFLHLTFSAPQKMNTKAQIKELALFVGNGLNVYVAVHDAIFRDSATLTSFFKNLLGLGVPMSKLLEKAENLVPLWDSIGAQVETFSVVNGSCLSVEEKTYLCILTRYVTAVRKTVTVLVARQRLAHAGSKGGPKNPMTWEAFKQREAEYQAAVVEYLKLGRELNSLAPAIFS